MCHAVHEQVVGPALAHVYEKQPIEWIYKFVKNSQLLIQSGDKDAVDIYEKFNKTQMPAWDLTNDQILSIMAYIKSETDKGPAQTATASTSGGTTTTNQTTGGMTISSGYLTVFLVVLLVVLAMILIVLIMLISVLTKYLRQKKGLDEGDQEIIEQKFDLGKLVRSPAFIFIVSFIFTAVVLKTVIDGLYHVGIQQGFAPTQPIAFSHKIHAGQYKINCQYCHTGVMKAKNANIPSPNICMNCHQVITKVTGQDQPSPEIAKIHKAIENNQPIEWVRVHTLQDFVYFNHSQHYNVGGIECQTCHGPVEEMEVIRQYAPLTMGWCIDCHRKTNVKTENNHYYDKLVELHSKVSKDPMKVEDIGGLECSKCHY